MAQSCPQANADRRVGVDLAHIRAETETLRSAKVSQNSARSSLGVMFRPKVVRVTTLVRTVLETTSSGDGSLTKLANIGVSLVHSGQTQMKQVLIASIVSIITTASEPPRRSGPPRLNFGTYAANVSSSANTSFGGIELNARRGPRGGTVIDITFEEKSGQRFTFNEIPLRRIPVGWSGASWQLQEECYILKDATHGDLSTSEWFRMVMENHPMHRLVTASNFPICPAGSDSVVLKFLAKRGVYFDVRLPLTVPEDGFGKIKPGRYLMLKNGSNRFENLVDMEVDIAEEALGKQTADLIFSHKNGEKFIINHLNLTRGHRSSRLASGLGKDIEDRCFGLDRGGRILGSKIEKFKCISKAFGGDLQTLRGRNAAICVIDDYSIIFTFPDTRTGPIRIGEVNLLLDFGNLHMLGDTVIRKGKRGGEDYDDELPPPESKSSRLG